MVSFVFGDEATNRTVISFFTLGREETARQLFHLPMIGDTFATVSLSLAGLIGAGTPSFVFVHAAFRHL
jgi:hypothetical protein